MKKKKKARIWANAPIRLMRSSSVSTSRKRSELGAPPPERSDADLGTDVDADSDNGSVTRAWPAPGFSLDMSSLLSLRVSSFDRGR